MAGRISCRTYIYLVCVDNYLDELMGDDGCFCVQKKK